MSAPTPTARHDRSTDVAPLTSKSRQTIGLLESLIKKFGQLGSKGNNHLFRLNIAAGLGDYSEQLGMNLCSAMRQMSGGSFPHIRAEDGLLENLQILASQVWPIFLLPQPDERLFNFRITTTHTFVHPVAARLRQLLFDDPVFRSLFPGAPEQTDDEYFLSVGSFATFSTGRDEGLQLATLPDTLLDAARFRQLLHGNDKTIWTATCMRSRWFSMRPVAWPTEKRFMYHI